MGFADASERLALTFTIPRDPRAPPLSIDHAESIVGAIGGSATQRPRSLSFESMADIA